MNDGIQSVDGNITVTADNNISLSDGTLIDAGSGTINLSAAGDITLGRLLTTNASDTAVRLTSTAGGIVDGGDTGGADVQATSGRLVIASATGVGASNALETKVDSLEVVNATSGHISISETDALLVVNAVQQTAGNLQIVSADGTLTVVDNGVAGNAVATVDGTVTL